eukprot:TRINITY_DN31679_c0_g1_i1.p1 TRINITY_DN31679_c0_g1~~TRINITY_DN31679_c0_g1_i1.p1  ORF type:complete len:488 (+),score=126.76 TRINITY_DN31679_c0_g1_i1:133-1596(+)
MGKLEVGAAVEGCSADGIWRRAQVVAVAAATKRSQRSLRLRYDGYSADWDEWLVGSSVRPASGSAAAAVDAAGATAVDLRSLAVGAAVSAQSASDGVWYPAEVLEISAARRRRRAPVKVRYADCGDDLDEWVAPSALRVATKRGAGRRGRGGNQQRADASGDAGAKNLRELMDVVEKQRAQIDRLEKALKKNAKLIEKQHTRIKKLEEKAADEGDDKEEDDEPEQEVRGKDTGLAPLRPVHFALREGTDPRLDPGKFVRYDPGENKTGAIMIVAPGGNYEEAGVNSGEGQPIAQWLTTLGITAIVLDYRCASEGHYWPAQFDDYEACARHVKAQAAAWGCDASRVGAIGFSAGGHLAAYAGLRLAPELRPDLQVLVYPAINTQSPYDGYMDCWRADFGWPAKHESIHVLTEAEGSASPPATFLASIVGDRFCPPKENAEPYVEVLRKLGTSLEYVVSEDEKMEHGCGLMDWWALPCGRWLRERGWAA